MSQHIPDHGNYRRRACMNSICSFVWGRTGGALPESYKAFKIVTFRLHEGGVRVQHPLVGPVFPSQHHEARTGKSATGTLFTDDGAESIMFTTVTILHPSHVLSVNLPFIFCTFYFYRIHALAWLFSLVSLGTIKYLILQHILLAVYFTVSKTYSNRWYNKNCCESSLIANQMMPLHFSILSSCSCGNPWCH